MCALAGAIALEQGRHDAGQRMQARRLVDRRDRATDRPATLLASQAHDAAESLEDDIIAEAIGARAGPAEARDAAIDEVGLLRFQRRVIDAQALCNAGGVAFD